MTATCLPMSGHLGDIIIVKRNFPAYPLLLAQSIVSNALKIIVNFIFVKSAQKILVFLALEIDSLEQNCVRALEPSLRTF